MGMCIGRGTMIGGMVVKYGCTHLHAVRIKVKFKNCNRTATGKDKEAVRIQRMVFHFLAAFYFEARCSLQLLLFVQDVLPFSQ